VNLHVEGARDDNRANLINTIQLEVCKGSERVFWLELVVFPLREGSRAQVNLDPISCVELSSEMA